MVLSRAGLIWVAWTRRFLVRGRCFWTLKGPGDCSWSQHRLLQMCELIWPCFCYKTGEDSRVSFWHNSWLLIGTLHTYCSASYRCFPSIPRDAPVRAVLRGRKWNWLFISTAQGLEIGDIESCLVLADHDCLEWMPSRSKIFHAQEAWEQIRMKGPQVQWAKGVWFAGNIPCHSFISFVEGRGVDCSIGIWVSALASSVGISALNPIGCDIIVTILH